ncbi:MAG: ATP-binding protein [Polyangiales bacterium]
MALDPRAFPILYADSDAESLLAFRTATQETFTTVTTERGADALEQLAKRDVAVLIAGQQLADMSGIELLGRARGLRPGTVRWFATHTPDLASALEAINVAQVSGYVTKPWEREALTEWLTAGLVPLQRERSAQSMEMQLWHGGQVAAATTIYEELVHELSNPLGALEINATLVFDLLETSLREAGSWPPADASRSSQPEAREQRLSIVSEALAQPALREALETAHEAHRDSLAAIEQIKSLVSRMRHGPRPVLAPTHGRCDVAGVVAATVRLVRAEIEKVAQLEVQLQAAPPTADIEGSVLGQVLLNLLLNAAQAVGSVVQLDGRIRIEGRERSGLLELTVEDNGPGIPPEHLERVFEPFFTTKENGTGLGLAICRELVSQSRGTIRVRNLPRRGVRFELTIPAARAD